MLEVEGLQTILYLIVFKSLMVLYNLNIFFFLNISIYENILQIYCFSIRKAFYVMVLTE